MTMILQYVEKLKGLLGRLGGCVVPEVIKKLKENRSSAVQEKIIDALSRIGKEAVKSLINLAEQDDYNAKNMILLH